MLTQAERREIDAHLEHYPDKPSACIEALKVVQSHRSWICDEALTDVAEYLDMSPHELDGVATFYNLIFRKPVGRHVILLCDSISCWLLGCEALQQGLCSRLQIRPGETTDDGRFTLLPMACLGTCDRAPALMIDEDLHRDLNEDQLDDLLGRYE